MAEFMTQWQLKQLKSHQYRSEGKSFLEKYVLNRFWNYLLNFIPISWAPNVITLIGVIVIVIPYLGMLFTNPDAKSDDAPAFWNYAMASGIFVFQCLDNLDGKQARRTQSSNALGEFFDHGWDAISDPFTLLAVLVAIGIGHHLDLFFVLGLVVIQDYCFYWRAHWTEKYVFGDVDIAEFQWIIIAVLVATGVSKEWLSASLFFGIQMRLAFVWLFIGLTAYYLGDVLVEAVRIAFFVSSSKSSDARTQQRRYVLAPLYPLALNIGLAVAARYVSDAAMVYEKYPVAFLTVYLLVGAKLSCRLLVANMTRSRMVTCDLAMLSYVFLFLTNPNIVPDAIRLSPTSGLFVAAVFATVDYLKYMTTMCAQMADTFNVYCLSLKKKKNPPVLTILDADGDSNSKKDLSE